MSHADLYFHANEQLLLKNLVPIEEGFFNELNKTYWNEEYQHLSFDEWKQVLSQNGYDVNRIKRNVNLKSMRQFFYEGEYLTPEINSLDPDWLLSPFTIPCQKVDGMAKADFEKGNYIMYFFSENNLFAIDYFIRHFDKIEEVQLYTAFKSLYVHCNYGFEYFPEHILSAVFSKADNREGLKVLEEADLIDEDGYLTIYRGEGERSTPLKKAYSWTTSPEIANRFGHFFANGKVYQGKVKAERILDFIDDREEDEVWVRFSDIEEMQELSSMTVEPEER